MTYAAASSRRPRSRSTKALAAAARPGAHRDPRRLHAGGHAERHRRARPDAVRRRDPRAGVDGPLAQHRRIDPAGAALQRLRDAGEGRLRRATSSRCWPRPGRSAPTGSTYTFHLNPAAKFASGAPGGRRRRGRQHRPDEGRRQAHRDRCRRSWPSWPAPRPPDADQVRGHADAPVDDVALRHVLDAGHDPRPGRSPATSNDRQRRLRALRGEGPQPGPERRPGQQRRATGATRPGSTR